MVSGFFTSPKDQARICSGLASPIRIASKLLTSSRFTYRPYLSDSAIRGDRGDVLDGAGGARCRKWAQRSRESPLTFLGSALSTEGHRQVLYALGQVRSRAAPGLKLVTPSWSRGRHPATTIEAAPRQARGDRSRPSAHLA